MVALKESPKVERKHLEGIMNVCAKLCGNHTTVAQTFYFEPNTLTCWWRKRKITKLIRIHLLGTIRDLYKILCQSNYLNIETFHCEKFDLLFALKDK